MQLGINTATPTQSFTGIKMTSKNRKDLSVLLNSYFIKPSLEVRDEIFTILDPYMQRQAKKISSDQYYYDDILQNMRLNLFDLLDSWRKRLKIDEVGKALNEAVENHRPTLSKRFAKQYEDVLMNIPNARRFKFCLFHNINHTQDARIPQTDETLVPWHLLNTASKERLIPSEEFAKQEHAESLDFFLEETNLTKYEKGILELIGKQGYNIEDISEEFNLTPQRVGQIKDKAIKHIRRKHHIEPPKKQVKQKNIDIQA